MRVLLLAALASGLACAPPCASREVLATGEGGVAVCTQASDCPRPAGVLECTSTEDQLRGCVGCEATACVRYTPRSCP